MIGEETAMHRALFQKPFAEGVEPPLRRRLDRFAK